MDKFAVVIFLATVYISFAAASIKIVDLKVPDALESGKEQNVILDCDFEVKDDEPGLSVKWFYGGEVEQVYQWIPGVGKPQALGILKDRVDLEYKATTDNHTMYRALKIKDLSPKLTGSYTCKVASFEAEDKATKKMIIYKTADPEEPQLEHLEEESCVICSAYGLYPEPEMKLYGQGSNYTLDAEDPEVNQTEDGFYNISIMLNYTDYDLFSRTIFTCEISIPETSYHQKTSLEYFPGGESTTQETVTEIDIDYPTNATVYETPDNFATSIVPSWIFTTTIALICLCFNFV